MHWRRCSFQVKDGFTDSNAAAIAA